MNSLPRLRCAPLRLALALGLSFLVAVAAEPVPEDDPFQSPTLLRLAITLPAKAQEELGDFSGGRRRKPAALASVREGGRTYRDVELQLKGNTTFQPLDGTPSLTLDFNEHVAGQTFHGLTKLSLNNSLQDPTKLHEKFGRELYAAAGVPVPRADHALVTLNGRELGLYVLVEGYGKTFLKRHFAAPGGNLYEGGTLRDLDRGLMFKSGQHPNDHSAVNRLIQAAREKDPDRRFAALTNVLDLDRFLSMVALEALLCHSDSYSMNRNNYRLYHDPAADRLVFMPHGLDRILGTHRSNLDLPVVPPAMGLVARAVLSTPEGRRRYVERAGTLFTNLFDGDRLGRRVREIDAKIRRERQRLPGDRQSWGNAGRPPEDDAADLCRRLERRIADLRLQFAQRSNLLALPVVAAFDATGTAPLTGWRVRWQPHQPPAEVAEVERDGRTLLRVRSAADATHATLYCRLVLPAGNYRLTGAMAAVEPAGANLPLSLLRYHSSDRFTTERHRLGPRELSFPIFVGATLPEEELDFVCEIRGPGKEHWLDPATLRLLRTEPAGRGRRRGGSAGENP